MSKTLKEIIDEVNTEQKINTQDDNSLKKLKEAANTEEGKKKYEARRSKIIDIIQNKIKQDRENGNLERYSEEVKKRRTGRKLSDLEATMTKVQGEVDVLGLEIADVDTQIGQARLGVATPATPVGDTGGSTPGGTTPSAT